MARFQFNIKHFYLLGSGLFLISALGNLYSLYVNWGFYNIGLKVSNISNILFNILLIILFVKLYNDIVKMESKTEILSSDLDKLLETTKEVRVKVK